MGIIENIKEAVKIVQQIDNIELYKTLLNLQAEAMELTEKLRERDKKITELQEALKIKGKLSLRDLAYYIIDDNGQLIDGPFCTKCFDVDNIMCRLVRTTGNIVQCQRCKLPFNGLNVTFKLKR